MRREWSGLILAALLAGCGGEEPPPTGPGGTPAPGGLAVTITGLPGGVSASVQITGPNGFSRALQSSGSLQSLTPGSYTVTAAEVTSGATTYRPSPASQVVSVVSASTATAAVTYTTPAPATSLNLAVEGMYLTQAIQRFDGSVPLVAGRRAYLRVFVVANQANTLPRPPVRVRLYHGETLVHTATVSSALVGVPTSANEFPLESSWNLSIAAGLVQPGLAIVADVDPDGVVPESSESDNSFPLSGTAAPVTVRSLPQFNIRFVPVLQSNGLQGNVSDLNKEQFLAEAKKLLPIGAYDAEVRAPYTTTAPIVESDNGNDAWNQILSEVRTLKTTDGGTQYYFGVIRTTYTSGTAGFGFVGGTARTAVGWDRLPSAAGIVAHELGHNMGRYHAPCGNAPAVDENYPDPTGKIGLWGLDLTTLDLKAPATADLMGYCSPDWISDYNWTGMMTYRAEGGTSAGQVPAAGEGLLIWGRMTSQGIVLEPAFRVSASPAALPEPGPHGADLLDQHGGVIRTIAFEAAAVADLPVPERHFAFVIPVAASETVAAVRIRAGGQSATNRATARPQDDPALRAERRGPGAVSLRWNPARYRMAMVRDAGTGEILSFARGGEVTLQARGRVFDIQFSDGVRTLTRRDVVPQ